MFHISICSKTYISLPKAQEIVKAVREEVLSVLKTPKFNLEGYIALKNKDLHANGTLEPTQYLIVRYSKSPRKKTKKKGDQ